MPTAIGEFPANRFSPNPQVLTQHVTWRWLVHEGRYVGDGDLWICPEEPGALTENNRSIHGSKCIGDFEANYAYNGAALWRWSPNGAPDGSHNNRYGMPNGKSELTLRNVGQANQTILLLESRGYWPDLGDWTVGWSSWPDRAGPLSYWHRGGANWAMADGAVRWMKLFDTGNSDCLWHIVPEPPDSHLDWLAIMPAQYR